MRIEITYIHHNCFVLKEGGSAFLFDVPADGFLPAGASSIISKEVSGHRLFMFTSHAHGDHFSPAPGESVSQAESICAVYSDDVRPGRVRLPAGADIHFIGPDKCLIVPCSKKLPSTRRTASDFDGGADCTSCEIQGLKITTFKSNDEGVAFLIEKGPLKIYFGGDLAKWSWEEDCSAEDRRDLEAAFEGLLKKLEGRKIHAAFSNADPRLSNWSGAGEFIDRISPDVFIPMHAFGNTRKVEEFVKGLGEKNINVFAYARPGDTAVFEIVT